MSNEISIQGKLACAVTAGTVANTDTSKSFDVLITTALAQFDHKSTPCAAASAKTAVPLGSCTTTAAGATGGYWVFLRNTTSTAADIVNVYVEYSSTNYAQCGQIPAGGFFMTKMVGNSGGTYPRLVFASATANLPVVESIVCDG